MRKLVPGILLVPVIAMAGDRHLADPPLSLAARTIVRQKMGAHSKQMTELVWSVVLLDYKNTAQIAQAIAVEPRLARPTTHDATELNAALPPRFFELQDELRTRAQQLEVASRTRDAAVTARTYGALAQTCVACHDAYLNRR